MKIYSIKTGIEKINAEDISECRTVLISARSKEARDALDLLHIEYEGDISNPKDITMCKLESQAACMAGTLNIPKHVDAVQSRNKVQLFFNRENILIVDDEGFTERILQRIFMKLGNREMTMEDFLCRYLSEILSRDADRLTLYNNKLMALEEQVLDDRTNNFPGNITPLRRELLVLRTYYDEFMDFARQLEENENGFFHKDKLKFFGTISDRADRFLGRTGQLLEYAQQIQDSYQFQVDDKTNKNMQLLTVISVIFYPLTLITGWFGMNFENMPGLSDGYYKVLGFSVIVVIAAVLWFKKNKLL